MTTKQTVDNQRARVKGCAENKHFSTFFAMYLPLLFNVSAVDKVVFTSLHSLPRQPSAPAA